MWRHIVFLALAVLGGTSGQEDCVPRPVQDKEILLNGTLTWRPNPDSNCTITRYIVTLQSSFSQEIVYNFETVNPSLDLTFLPSCQRWFINVLAVAGIRVSGNSYFQAQMPIFPGTDLSLNITAIDHVGTYAAMSWQFVNQSYSDCGDTYRVTVVGRYHFVPFDRYTELKAIVVPGIAACGEYNFNVRAIHVSYTYVEGPLSSILHDITPRVQGPPEMVSIFSGPTFVNTTWRLEDYFLVNRCTVYSFRVTGYLFDTTIPIEDREDRPLYQINFGNLQPSTVYTIEVSIENSAGWSESTIVLLQTTPATGDMVASENKQIEVTLT